MYPRIVTPMGTFASSEVPGVGGVEPREGIPLSPRFPEDPPRAE